MRKAITFVFCLTAFAAPAHAEMLRFDVVSREPAALEGRVFGNAGTVEKIVARATIGLAPSDKRNAVIVDIGSAPRNAQGLVEAVTDVVILRPARPNGAIVLELPNRGRVLVMNWFNDASDFAAPAPANGAARGGRGQGRGGAAPSENSFGLSAANDAGNGFLLEQGFTLVWAGWQGDVTPGSGFSLTAPVAKGLTGTSRDLWTFNNAEAVQRVALTYPAAEPFKAKLTVRDAPDAAARTPQGLTFKFIDASTVEITRPSGAPPASVYELVYTARDPAVMGTGFAALRDVGSFLRFDTSSANPLAANGRTGIDRAIATGVSQSGRALRDFLYFGFNEDEKARKVFDGMMPIIPGARRSFTNARFSQPGRNPGPLADRLYPVDQFPFTYATQTDSLSGKRDGLLLRCTASNTCPRVVEMDSEYEFWGSHAALNVVDAAGKAVPVPANVRLFLFTGAQHSSSGDGLSQRNAACTLSSTPVRTTPITRAMILNIDNWVHNNVAPPASRFPMVSDKTLVALKDAYPSIPQLPYKMQIGKAFWIDQTDDGPMVRGEYPLLVPKAGPDGNALAGIRLPIIEVPKATYTGWNPVANSASAEGLCTQAGSAVPFAATRAERMASGDPRPSLEELYPTQEAYVAKVRAAADKLVADRFMLKEDADKAVAAARDNKLAKLGAN